jgi:hypothetical protein
MYFNTPRQADEHNPKLVPILFPRSSGLIRSLSKPNILLVGLEKYNGSSVVLPYMYSNQVIFELSHVSIGSGIDVFTDFTWVAPVVARC